jgi:hypothetical protein
MTYGPFYGAVNMGKTCDQVAMESLTSVEVMMHKAISQLPQHIFTVWCLTEYKRTLTLLPYDSQKKQPCSIQLICLPNGDAECKNVIFTTLFI